MCHDERALLGALRPQAHVPAPGSPAFGSRPRFIDAAAAQGA
jgi:hypothetical protein